MFDRLSKIKISPVFLYFQLKKNSRIHWMICSFRISFCELSSCLHFHHRNRMIRLTKKNPKNFAVCQSLLFFLSLLQMLSMFISISCWLRKMNMEHRSYFLFPFYHRWLWLLCSCKTQVLKLFSFVSRPSTGIHFSLHDRFVNSTS